MLTCCSSDIRVLSLFIASLQVQCRLLFRVKCDFRYNIQHAFAIRRTAWFAENSTTINEYELTTAANNRLLRHRFRIEFCLHAQPANQVLSLIKIIVNDGLECDKRKKFTATDFFDYE